MMPAERPTTFVTVGTFWNPWPAWMLRNKLADGGVDAFVHDEFAVTMNWLYANAMRGVKVQVPLEQVEKAQAILDRDDSSVLLPRPATCASADADVCSRCGSSEIRREVANVRVFLLVWLVSGIPLSVFSTAVECYDCGHRNGPPATFTLRFGVRHLLMLTFLAAAALGLMQLRGFSWNWLGVAP